MRLFFLSLLLLPFFCTAQNVGIGTTVPAAKLHVKGTEDISQVVIEGIIGQSNSKPMLVFKQGVTTLFSIHSDQASNLFIGSETGASNLTGSGSGNTFLGGGVGRLNTSGNTNTAIGATALFNNTTGANLTSLGFAAMLNNTTGINNIAVGPYALYNNRGRGYSIAIGPFAMYNSDNTTNAILTKNIAIGNNALRGSNTTANNSGTANTVIGDQSMAANASGTSNTAVGANTLPNNTIGNFNTGIGMQSLNSNTAGLYNSALGMNALYTNQANSYNTAVGYNALFNTTAADYNTAIGSQAGDAFNNGFNNVFVGANTDVTGPGYFNVIAMGQATVVAASSVARFGNAATGSYGGWAGWTNLSDGRFKSNVQENVPGLAFIIKLRPVTYNMDASRLDAFLHHGDSPQKKAALAKNTFYLQALHEKEQVTYTGFIAQEVEKSAQEMGFNFSGVDKARNENDTYGLRYAEFVVPLVKAVQELEAENKILKAELQAQQKRFDALEKVVLGIRGSR